jgi:hypothetical protein
MEFERDYFEATEIYEDWTYGEALDIDEEEDFFDDSVDETFYDPYCGCDMYE